MKPLGFFATGRQIAARETPLGLYKGLGAVISGIVPKMAIRFASFESGWSKMAQINRVIYSIWLKVSIVYKGWLTGTDGKISPSGTFLGMYLVGEHYQEVMRASDDVKTVYLAGLGAGATEAVAVVTPMEVVKIRLQAQQRKAR